MSLVTNIKDFLELLSNISANYNPPLDLPALETLRIDDRVLNVFSSGLMPNPSSINVPHVLVIQQALLFFGKSIISAIAYLVTFQWLRDFSYLPLLAPEQFGVLNYFRTLDPESKGSLLNVFSFASIEHSGVHQLVAGFCNSFFLSLPFSIAHLVTVRRLFSQGLLAAMASSLGVIAAQSFVLIGVLYGLRVFILPYTALQPLLLVLGFLTSAVVIKELVQEKKLYLLPLTHRGSLVRIAILSFMLALCEETTVFHPVNNLTLNTGTTYLEFSATGNNLLQYILDNTIYLVTFILGRCVFSAAICYFGLKAHEKVCSLTHLTVPQLTRQTNRVVLLLVVAFTFASFPYYGLDYVSTKVVGFLPEDPVLTDTIFSPTRVNVRNPRFTGTDPKDAMDTKFSGVDVNYFDNGIYIDEELDREAPTDFQTRLNRFTQSNNGKVSGTPSEKYKKDKIKGKLQAENDFSTLLPPIDDAPTPETIDFDEEGRNLGPDYEQLNYQSDYYWYQGHHRARTVDPDPNPLFQEPKNYFRRMRLDQEIKRLDEARNENRSLGLISKWKEGALPSEHKDLSSITKNASPQKTGVLAKSRSQDNGHRFPLDPSHEDDNSVLKDIGEGNVSFLHEEAITDDDEELLEDDYETFLTVSSFKDDIGNNNNVLPAEDIIKRRCLVNPVYKALLRTDIDTFLAREPAKYKVTQNQESNLFEKRAVLARYYDWLRNYSGASIQTEDKLSDDNDNMKVLGKTIVNGHDNDTKNLVKSLDETPFLQQSKGTLDKTAELFNVSFDATDNPRGKRFNNVRVLSYDQTLYRDPSISNALPVHKEMKQKDVENDNFSQAKHIKRENEIDNFSQAKRTKQVKKNKKSKPITGKEKEFASKSLLSMSSRHPSLHEELFDKFDTTLSPFIEESDSTPVYAGWDDRSRRFVITNKFAIN